MFPLMIAVGSVAWLWAVSRKKLGT